MTEKQFTEAVLEAAERFGWLMAHFHDSRREVVREDGTRLFIGDKAAKGFPDLVLCKPPTVLFVELKAERGKTTKEQTAWLTSLADCDGVHVRLWRPGDMDDVIRLLSNGKAEVTA